jgi:hypothetical protein
MESIRLILLEFEVKNTKRIYLRERGFDEKD